MTQPSRLLARSYLIATITLALIARPEPLEAQRVPGPGIIRSPEDTSRTALPAPRLRLGHLDKRREPFVGFGAAVGGIAGAIWAFDQTRGNILGPLGGFLACAATVPGGMIGGALIGYVVSLPFVH